MNQGRIHNSSCGEGGEGGEGAPTYDFAKVSENYISGSLLSFGVILLTIYTS